MKLAVLAASFALSFALAGAAYAADPAPAAKPLTPQQQKMKDCNAQAEGKTGDERKQFMSQCLKAKPAPAAKPTTQQEKMKACNTQAGDKKGDDRKKFMSDCLKGSPSAPAAS